MNYSLLEALIPYMKTYEEKHPEEELSIDSFLIWAQQQRTAEMVLAPDAVQHLNGDISRHIGELYKHAKGYMKKGFNGTSFTSMDDFAYLAVLQRVESMRKTELIYENIGEVSPGMEVIKRLLRHGFIEEFKDPDDKRSKRVSITPAGRQAFFQILQEMHLAGELIVGDLSISERLQLLSLLKRLRNFHQHIFDHARSESLDTIHTQYAMN